MYKQAVGHASLLRPTYHAANVLYPDGCSLEFSTSAGNTRNDDERGDGNHHFPLVPGRDGEKFIAANADVGEWLKRKPGFISRRVRLHTDGLVTDRLRWSSVANGERAACGIVTESASSPKHAAIDHSTVAWSVSRCRHRIGQDVRNRPALSMRNSPEKQRNKDEHAKDGNVELRLPIRHVQESNQQPGQSGD